MPTAENAMERLSGRIGTLDGLRRRGIVTEAILHKQMKSLLSSRDAHVIFDQCIESNKKALKILSRIEDPDGWRDLFAKDKDAREEIFFTTLENIMDSDDDGETRIMRMLQLTCLPFFSAILPAHVKKNSPASEAKPNRVSVLD